jgi:hypothetical protein
MNGYWNFITVAHCPHDAAHGELGEASLGLVSAQPRSTRRTLAGLLSQVALGLAGQAGMRLAAALVSRRLRRGRPRPGPRRGPGR